MNADEWIAEAQEYLWYELDHAIRFAVDGMWSMQTEGIALMLADAARLIGATDWREVPWPLAAGEVYSTLLDAAGIPHNYTVDAARQDEALMRSSGGTISECRAAYSLTRAEIRKAIHEAREEQDA